MSKPKKWKTFYALAIAWQLGFLISFPIVGFLFLGLLIDWFLQTQPLFLIIGLFVGIAVSVYEGYHLFIPLLEQEKDNHDKH